MGNKPSRPASREAGEHQASSNGFSSFVVGGRSKRLETQTPKVQCQLKLKSRSRYGLAIPRQEQARAEGLKVEAREPQGLPLEEEEGENPRCSESDEQRSFVIKSALAAPIHTIPADGCCKAIITSSC